VVQFRVAQDRGRGGFLVGGKRVGHGGRVLMATAGRAVSRQQVTEARAGRKC
jgi:hypothetical protein